MEMFLAKYITSVGESAVSNLLWIAVDLYVNRKKHGEDYANAVEIIWFYVGMEFRRTGFFGPPSANTMSKMSKA